MNLLNWQNFLTNKHIYYKLLLRAIIVFISIGSCTFLKAQNDDDIYVSMKSKNIEDINSTVLTDSVRVASITLARIGENFPCGERIAVSVEDDRYYFCKMSSTMATVAPGTTDGSILLPDGTIALPHNSSKTDNVPPKTDFQNVSYNEVLNRINSIRPGVYNSTDGYRWSIVPEDLENYYPDNTFDVELEGETRTAFNSEALFYEMLVTIQKLSQDNAQLELRLSQIENKIGVKNHSFSSEDNYIKILTNPTNSNILDLEYQIEEGIKNANILLSSTSGKIVQTIAFQKRGFGYEYINFDLPKGLYYCTLALDDKMIESQKFVVQ